MNIEVGDILFFKDGKVREVFNVDNKLNPPYYLIRDFEFDSDMTVWVRSDDFYDLDSVLKKVDYENKLYKL
jgi:hypothetical protein